LGAPFRLISTDFGCFCEINAVVEMALLLAIFLLSVRLVLLLPLSALERLDWKSTLEKAWRDMRGSYRFALVVSFAAVLPMMVADHYLLRLYRSLSIQNNLPVRLTHQQWEALLVRSAQLTFDYIVIAALASTLYGVIETRTKSTAP
jgi:membrane-anchored glycerophosphoryl diester phosphodiesterase (GDPDase)